MSRFLVPALALLCTSALLAPTLQKRVKEAEAADFPGLMTKATEQWNAERFGGCIASLQEAIALATQQRIVKIRAALPQPPAGWEQLPEKEKDLQAAAGFAAGLGAIAGNVVERKWKQTEGRGNMNVTVSADAPMVGMLSTYMTNPALLGENKELIEYGPHKAVLETQQKGSRYGLQIVIDGKHLVDVGVREMTEDALFAMWNQEAVDKLSAALSL